MGMILAISLLRWVIVYLVNIKHIWRFWDFIKKKIFFFFKYDREISQTRGKSKEHVQFYLSRIFVDRTFDSTGSVGDPTVKESRAKALGDLWINDRFIWELPVFQKDNTGNIVHDDEGNPIFIQKPKNPFTGPYVRNALRILFFEHYAEWRHYRNEKFTVPQIAFVCTLVCNYPIISWYIFTSPNISR